MRNLTIILLIVALATVLAVGGLQRAHDAFQSYAQTHGATDTMSVDAINFWGITSEAIQNEDPDGWAVLVARTRGVGELRADMRAELHTWQMEQRHAIFLRRYGFRYDGADARD